VVRLRLPARGGTGEDGKDGEEAGRPHYLSF
jgi:hypothetical protein